MKFTLYTANCTENAKNAVYPNKAEIDNEEDFKAALCRDHEVRNIRIHTVLYLTTFAVTQT